MFVRSGFRAVALASAAGGLVLAGCSSSGSGSSSAGGAASSSAAAPASNASSSSASQPSGPVTVAVKNGRLTAPDGKTLYYNTVDTAKKIDCVAMCATYWPPLLGMPKPGAGLDEHDLSTAMRPDGSTQITFYGHPLYEFGKDSPGQATGQGLVDQGGHWVVATPDQAQGGKSSSAMSSGGGGGGGYGP